MFKILAWIVLYFVIVFPFACFIGKVIRFGTGGRA